MLAHSEFESDSADTKQTVSLSQLEVNEARNRVKARAAQLTVSQAQRLQPFRGRIELAATEEAFRCPSEPLGIREERKNGNILYPRSHECVLLVNGLTIVALRPSVFHHPHILCELPRMSENNNVKTPNLGDAPDPVNAAKPAARTTAGRRDTVTRKATAKTTKDPAAMRNENVTLNEKDTNKAKARGDQLEKPARKCGCDCDINCNCKCTCACQDHCVCRIRPCDGECGNRVSRNLVISIDGTSNQFGTHNTNVVELHSQILTSENQAKYYNSGIGTYVPPEAKMSMKYLRQRVDNGLDLAFALNFKENLLKAYRWLSQIYQPGDKIFFFGFSRGAHQIRALAGLIQTVGLIEAGNEDLIPLSVAPSPEGLLLILEFSAYEIYLERHKGEPTDDAKEIAENFKKTFSRDVRIHFLGAWDTVSSVGVFQGKPLPLASSAQHICIFRHALALDERRVKFLPEYVDHNMGSVSDVPVDIKEVWFAGTHSDIGGGIKKNLKLNLSSVPLLWMENEASSAGLRLRPQPTGGAWNMGDLKKDDVHESLTSVWQPLEYLPLSRLSFKTPQDVTMSPHLGAGRVIVPGQRIHISVAFKSKGYTPRATFLQENSIQWESFVGKELQAGTFDWVHRWANQVEMDLFDASFTMEAIQELEKIWANEEPSENEGDTKTKSYWVNRLAFMALSGQLAANYLSELKQSSRKSIPKFDTVLELFQKLQEEHPDTFDADVATLLGYKASLLFTAKEVDAALHTYQKAETIWLNIARAHKASGQATETLALCIGKLYRPSHLNLSNDDMISIQRGVQSRQTILPGNLNHSLASSLHYIGVVLYFLGQYEDAVHADEEAVRLRRKLAETDPTGNMTGTMELAYSLHHLGISLNAVNRHQDALCADEEATELQHKLFETVPTITRDLAASLHNRGLELIVLGHHDKAIHALEKAIKCWRTVAETDPTIAKDLATSLQNLSIGLSAVGRHEDALQVDKEVVQIRRELVKKDPAFTKDLAQSLHNLGLDLLALGHHEDAVHVNKESVELRRKLAETDPSITKELATSLQNLSIGLSLLGRQEEVLQLKEEYIELLRKLAETDPTIIKDLASSLHNLGGDLRSADRHEDALNADNEAVRLRRHLVQTDPTILKDLAFSLHNLGVDLNVLGHHEDALNVNNEAVGHWHQLVQTDPTITEDLANSVDNLAFALSALGRQEEALQPKAESVELRRKLAETDPTVAKNLAKSLDSLAYDLSAVGRHSDAVHVNEEAIEIYHQLTGTDHTITEDLVLSLHNLGVALSGVGRHEDAVRVNEEAVELWRKLVERDPALTENLASSLNNLGVDLSVLGRREAALRTKEECIELLRPLAETDPTVAKDLAKSLDNLACDFNAVGRHVDAVYADEEAIQVYRKLKGTDDTVTDDLALALYNLGIALSGVGRHEDAVRANEEAIGLWRKLVERDPALIGDLASSLNNLGVDLSVLGHQEAALRTKKECIELLRKLAETDPIITRDLANSLHDLALNLYAAALHEDAVHADEEAVQLHRKLGETDPTIIKDLAPSLESLGFGLRTVGRHEEALKATQEAVGLYRKVSETDSTILDYALPHTLQNLGFDLTAVNRHEDAVRVNEEGVELYQKVVQPTENTELEYASMLHSLAACLRAVGRYDDGLQAQEKGDSIYRRLGEMNPGDTARSIHDHAADYRTIGLHEDSLRAEEGAIELYRKVVQTEPALTRDLVEALELRAEDLHALGREEDAARANAEVLALQSTASEGGPTSGADAAVEPQSLLAETPAIEAQIEEPGGNEAERDTAGESQRSASGYGDCPTNLTQIDVHSLRPAIHGATIEEAGGNAAEKHAAVESQSFPADATRTIHEAKEEAGGNDAERDTGVESQRLPADSDATRTIDEAVIEEGGGNEAERDGHEERPAIVDGERGSEESRESDPLPQHRHHSRPNTPARSSEYGPFEYDSGRVRAVEAIPHLINTARRRALIAVLYVLHTLALPATNTDRLVSTTRILPFPLTSRAHRHASSAQQGDPVFALCGAFETWSLKVSKGRSTRECRIDGGYTSDSMRGQPVASSQTQGERRLGVVRV
ncbi:hypothetical protein FB451DRAFT_1358840 [Mycena latifolia]|nr:hypothetical protein FB451DRAFT_1358840 [Mycena latifolia]